MPAALISYTSSSHLTKEHDFWVNMLNQTFALRNDQIFFVNRRKEREMVRQKGKKVRKRKQTQLIVNKKGKQSADQVPKKY